MRRIQRFHALSVFGDMKPHDYDTAVRIGSLHISNPANRMEIWPGQKIRRNMYASDVFEGMIKQLMQDGLLKRVENERIKQIRLQGCKHQTHPSPDGLCIAYQISHRDWDLQLTERGRECLGMEQIARDGDYGFYKNFDGSIDGAKKINPDKFKLN